MRIIHYIRDFSATSEGTLLAAKQMLTSTAKMTESHLLTTCRMSEEMERALLEQYGIVVHYLAHNEAVTGIRHFMQGRQAKNLLKELRPDIVHVYGSWDATAAVVEQQARKANIVTIVSPLGGLSTANLNTSFWKHKLPRLIMYQFWMMRNCTSVIVTSASEGKDTENFKVKSRIETLGEVSNEWGEQLMAAYRKALDSSYQKLITKEEKRFVRDAVKLAVLKDNTETLLTFNSDMSYRRIFLYAYDEDAIDLLTQGTQKAQLAMPPTLNVEAVKRYKNKKAKERKSLSDVDVRLKKLSIPQEKTTEISAVKNIAAAKHVKLKRMTLRQWTELYLLFRVIDFNEELAAEELCHQGLKGITKKIQKKLSKYYDLPQGFNIF